MKLDGPFGVQVGASVSFDCQPQVVVILKHADLPTGELHLRLEEVDIEWLVERLRTNLEIAKSLKPSDVGVPEKGPPGSGA